MATRTSQYYRDSIHRGGIKLNQCAREGAGQNMTCEECGKVREVSTERKWAYVKCDCSIKSVGFAYPTKHNLGD